MKLRNSSSTFHSKARDLAISLGSGSANFYLSYDFLGAGSLLARRISSNGVFVS